MTKYLICKVCGKPVKQPKGWQKYHKRCKKEAYRMWIKENYK